MTSYLVTGGAGFIGSHLATELLRRGHTVRIVDNLITGKRRNLAFSMGGGLKRILRYGGQDVSRVQLIYPTVRASVGVAF